MNESTRRDIERLVRRASATSYGFEGRFLVRAAPSPQHPIVEADRLLTDVGYRPLGTGWSPVSWWDGTAILARMLHGTLFRGQKLVSAPKARTLAEKFADAFAFDESSVCLTNLRWESGQFPHGLSGSPPSFSWGDVSEATFDAGIVCFGRGKAGLVWIEQTD